MDPEIESIENWTDDGKRHTRWRFTLNNWTNSEFEKIKKWQYVRYIVVGREIAPTTGTPHLQGYVEWNNERKFDVIRKINPRISWRTCNATAAANRKYCTKEDPDFYEFGEPAKQGERNDLLACKEMIDNGASELEVAEMHFNTWAGAYKALDRYAKLKMQHRSMKKPPTIEWIWGLSGRGKSYPIQEQYGEENVFVKDETRWWDDYKPGQVIIVDDFDGKWPFRNFLRFLDKYKYQGEVKGGFVKINSDLIFITCEHPPDYFWQGNELEQVTSRLSNIREVVGENKRTGKVWCNTNNQTSQHEKNILGIPT